MEPNQIIVFKTGEIAIIKGSEFRYSHLENKAVLFYHLIGSNGTYKASKTDLEEWGGKFIDGKKLFNLIEDLTRAKSLLSSLDNFC